MMARIRENCWTDWADLAHHADTKNAEDALVPPPAPQAQVSEGFPRPPDLEGAGAHVPAPSALCPRYPRARIRSRHGYLRGCFLRSRPDVAVGCERPSVQRDAEVRWGDPRPVDPGGGAGLPGVRR